MYELDITLAPLYVRPAHTLYRLDAAVTTMNPTGNNWVFVLQRASKFATNLTTIRQSDLVVVKLGTSNMADIRREIEDVASLEPDYSIGTIGIFLGHERQWPKRKGT